MTKKTLPRIIVAFDCDGTLIDFEDKPRSEIVNLAKALSKCPAVSVIVWSGGGQSYAEMVARRVGLEDVECFSKFDARLPTVDIAIDDEKIVKGVRKYLQIGIGSVPSYEDDAEER